MYGITCTCFVPAELPAAVRHITVVNEPQEVVEQVLSTPTTTVGVGSAFEVNDTPLTVMLNAAELW